jgi:hypothetical protein
MEPTIGRIVIYRSRTGNYDVPAIVSATTSTLHLPGVEAGYVPTLNSDEHVHLTVFTPGLPGKGKSAEEAEFLVASEAGLPAQPSSGGTYQEWNVPQNDLPEGSVPRPGTWRWPQRV